MRGINRNTGKALEGVDHLRQSIRDILTTPIGSRVMRREYGSRLFELLDKPLNHVTQIDLYAATVEALQIWEPRIEVLSVKTQTIDDGKVTLEIKGIYVETGQTIVTGVQI